MNTLLKDGEIVSHLPNFVRFRAFFLLVVFANFMSYKFLYLYFGANHLQITITSNCLAASSFDIFLATSSVVTVYAFLFVAIAGAIRILCHVPAFIRDPAFIWYNMGLHTPLIRDQGLLLEASL